MNYCATKFGAGSEEFDSLASGLLQLNTKEEIIEYIRESMLDQYLFDQDHFISKEDIVDVLNALKPQLLKETISENDISNIILNFNALFGVTSENVVPEDKINFDNRARLFSVLSSRLNEYMFNNLKNDIFKMTVYNPTAGTLVVSRSDLNTSIKTYKNELFRALVGFISSEPNVLELIESLGDGDLYDPNGDALINGFNYKLVMEIAKNKIASLTISGPINLNISTEVILKYLLPIKAYYLLNNFDSFVKVLGEGDILISPQLTGKLEIFSDKYTLSDQTTRRGSFNDGFKDVDADKITGKIFYNFISTLQKNIGEQCTRYDLNAVFKHVQNLIADNATYASPGIVVTTVGFALLLDPNLSAKEKSDILIDAFQNSLELRNRVGANVADAFANALIEYNQVYENVLSTKSIKDRKTLAKKFDFATQFIHEIFTHLHTAYLSVEPEGIRTKTDTRVLRGKNHIVEDIKSKIIDNLSINRWQIYNPRYIVGGGNRSIKTYNDIYSPRFQKYVRDLTGINIASKSIQEQLEKPGNINKLSDFLIELNRLVRNEILPYKDSKNIESLVTTALNNFKLKQEFVAFTNLLIADLGNKYIMLYDQQGNNIPTQNVPNTIADFSKNLKEFNEQFGYDNKSIFNTFSGLTSTIADDSKITTYTDRLLYRSDFAVGKRFIAARQLTSDEIASVALNYDFIDGIQKYETFFNQIECVSDKPRIPVFAFNIHGKYNGKEFIDLNKAELRDIYYEQHKSYYLKIENDLISDYNKLFNTSYFTLEECIRKLETLNYSELYNLMKAYNKTHPDNRIELKDQIHYVNGVEPLLDAVGNPILDLKTKKPKTKKVLRFNNTLYVNIAASHNQALLNKLLDDGLNDTISFLRETAVPIKTKISDWNLIDRLFSDVDHRILEQYFKQSRWVLSDNNGNITDTTKAVIEKWFLMQLLATDADLMVSIKQPYIHGDNKQSLKISQMEDLSDFRTWKNVSMDKIYAEMSSRMVKGKKRNNSAVASYEPMQLGRKYGVGKTMKIAIVDSLKTDLYTYNGFKVEGLDVHDGGTFVNGIHSYWEEGSYPGKGYKGTGKTIGLFPNGATFTQLKHAEFVITNELIRNSYNNSDANHYNFELIFKKMNQIASIEDLIRNYNSSENPALGYEVYIKENGKIYQLNNFDLNSGKFTWMDIASGELLEKSNILNNVYDLWMAFGGAESMSKNDDGLIKYSNISQEIVSDLISEYESSAKTQVIAKISDKSACKSGVTNLNPQSTMFTEDEEFEYFEANTSRMGVQLDYGHEADESMIPALTQVLTALAFNGENIELCNSIYEDLGQILENSLRPLLIAWNSKDHKEFHKKIAKDLFESLKKSAVSSNALDIVRDTLESLILEAENKGEFKQLPYSSHEIFAKVTSDFISNLNASSLRLRFSGIAIIQNPSHGIIGITEDIHGNKYTNTDLVEYGEELGFTGTSKQIIAQVLQTKDFAPQLINSASDLTISDWCTINGVETEIKTPYDLLNVLKKLNESAIVYKLCKQRDLKPTDITFIDEFGIKHSLWLLDSTTKKLSSPKNRLYLLYYRANLKLIGDKVNPGFYATYQDYLSGNVTKISQVNYKPGEQILPKVNKTAQGLNDSLAHIKRTGVNYFVTKVQNDVIKRSNIEAEKDKFLLTCVTPKLEIIYTSNTPDSNAILANLDNKLIIEEDKKFFLTNQFGEKIVEVPSPQVSFNISTLSNGKEQVIIYSSEDSYANVCVIAQNNKNVTAYYDGGYFKKFCRENNDLDLREGHINDSIFKLAKKLYNSFLMSNYTISARIPSQAFLSFMANETVAFLEDDSNNGYVNIYEIIFQGSDFDVKLLTSLKCVNCWDA